MKTQEPTRGKIRIFFKFVLPLIMIVPALWLMVQGTITWITISEAEANLYFAGATILLVLGMASGMARLADTIFAIVVWPGYGRLVVQIGTLPIILLIMGLTPREEPTTIAVALIIVAGIIEVIVRTILTFTRSSDE